MFEPLLPVLQDLVCSIAISVCLPMKWFHYCESTMKKGSNIINTTLKWHCLTQDTFTSCFSTLQVLLWFSVQFQCSLDNTLLKLFPHNEGNWKALRPMKTFLLPVFKSQALTKEERGLSLVCRTPLLSSSVRFYNTKVTAFLPQQTKCYI